MCKLSVQHIDSPRGFCYDRDLDEVLQQPIFVFSEQHSDVSDGADDTEDDDPATPIAQALRSNYGLERWRGRLRGKAATLRTYRDGSLGGCRKAFLHKLEVRISKLFARGEPA
jgi:hypothetical protein